MEIRKEDGLGNVMDVFWDGWFNSFKTFNSFQSGVEQKSLNAMESQKEWIELFHNQLVDLEEDSKKLTTKWKTNLQDVLNRNGNEMDTENLFELVDRYEEIGNIPFKASYELLSKSHAQLETILKEALDQQQKNRANVLNAVADYVNLLKQAQNLVFKS